MHLSTLALTVLTLGLTSTTTASLPPIAYRIPMSPNNARTNPNNPALTWHVSHFDIGCSQGGCVYNFAIQGFSSENTPGFNTTCNGTTEAGDYAPCRNKGVLAQIDPQVDANGNGASNWTVKAQHQWREGAYSEFYALGEKNVTEAQTRFTIPVKEVYGVA
ncbi:uncharacterized protein BDV17DRAFT_287196 [Aspergillus undulatus]|uniref:uncharacterized protein n=1 Tax=Aspergillus undulatus TaxID=1810928 RepID=UPI003CCD9574